AIEIEPRQLSRRFFAGRLGIGGRLQALDRTQIRLFAVENGRDVGDGARRRNEAGRQRITGYKFWRGFGWNRNGDIGPTVGCIQRRNDAGMDLRVSLCATALKRTSAAAYARLDDGSADLLTATLDGCLMGESEGRTA